MKFRTLLDGNVLALILCLTLSAWGLRVIESECEKAANDYTVEHTYWLYDQLFTEGLYYDSANARVLESTGLEGQSVIRSYKFDDENDEITDIKVLYKNPDNQFGEGFTKLDDKFYQLTYKNGIINVFREENIGAEDNKLVIEKTSAIPRDKNCEVPEGWGLTNDNKFLYMSDGTNRIFRFSPTDLKAFEQKEFEKQYKEGKCPEESKFGKIFAVMHPETGEPLNNLNELELVGKYMYANIWNPSNHNLNQIVKIKLEDDSMIAVKIYDFCVLKEKVCDALKKAGTDSTCSTINEFNGIAYDETTSNFILTGKNWPEVFRVTLSDNTSI